LPRTPIWIDAARIWDGDEHWYARLVDQAVVCPASPRNGSATPHAKVVSGFVR